MLYNYIVKKKEDKVPECDKLFWKKHSLGKKVSLPEIKPRKKPNQYLGLPVEHQIKLEPDKHVIEHKTGNETSDGGDTEEQASSELIVTNKMNLKTHPAFKGKHNMGKKSFDPLTYLSDYQTGDERNRRLGQKIRRIYEK